MLGSYRSTVAPLKSHLARPLAWLRLPPNAVTMAAIPLSLAAAALLLCGRPLEALPAAVLASLIDLVDGEVARLQDRQTPFGNYLETVVDRIVEGSLLVALTVRYPFTGALALTLSMLTSYAKARVGLVIVTDNHDWPACGDHADRMALILLAVVSCAFPFHLLHLSLPQLALGWLAAVAAVGFIQRVRYARCLIEQAEQNDTLLPYMKRRP